MLPPTSDDAASPRLRDEHAPAATCARHEDRPAYATCARCGRGACIPCTHVLASGESLCATCEADEGGSIAWERRRELGIGRAIGLTVAGVLLRPRWFFGQRTRERALWPTLLFGLVMHVAGAAAHAGWSIAFAEQTRAEMRADPIASQMLWLASDEAYLAQLALSPLAFFLTIYLQASLWWITLRAVGGLRRPFHVIVRALCLVQAASLLVPIVAPLGFAGPFGQGISFAFAIWVLWLQVIAVSRMQGIPVARGALAFTLWVAVAGVLTCLLSGVLAAAVASQIRLPNI